MLQDVCQTSSNIYTGFLKRKKLESRVILEAVVVKLRNAAAERIGYLK
jgi:hypothetical protein